MIQLANFALLDALESQDIFTSLIDFFQEFVFFFGQVVDPAEHLLLEFFDFVELPLFKVTFTCLDSFFGDLAPLRL